MSDIVSQLYCKKCGQPKLRNDFYDQSRQKHLPPEQRRKQGKCKDCAWDNDSNEARRIRRANNPVKQRKDDRKHKLSRKYGITPLEYECMFREQNGVCAICKHPETAFDPRHGIVRRLAVDHCHKTGKIRGLLCNRCNRLLGKCNDDVTLFYSAADYLKK